MNITCANVNYRCGKTCASTPVAGVPYVIHYVIIMFDVSSPLQTNDNYELLKQCIGNICETCGILIFQLIKQYFDK